MMWRGTGGLTAVLQLVDAPGAGVLAAEMNRPPLRGWDGVYRSVWCLESCCPRQRWQGSGDLHRRQAAGEGTEIINGKAVGCQIDGKNVGRI